MPLLRERNFIINIIYVRYIPEVKSLKARMVTNEIDPSIKLIV